jgi:hypothetical protein
MSSKHTPGPWAATNDRVYADGVPICALSWGTGSVPGSESHANARLIAAAPELLDRLKRLVGIDWSKGGLAHDDALMQARAAIAAAEGGDA